MTPEPEIIFGLVIGLPILGLLAMIGFPKEWQSVQGWLLVSFVGIPGFLCLVALLVNVPMLMFGALFLGGIAATKVKR
ncbi:hypothetical protein [Salinicola peritrichatus]|uniref:hypothetical protein n=1 Tax=Salinicola peritrichatus TaxID=1267424 RepID=UPI000DA151C6|nr:hypothetical protein [Salinicola peritrichatus]